MDNQFTKFIRTDELTFKYAKGMRDIIGKEIHPYHEIFFYINGNAEFISELGTEKLLPHTIVIIPKETFHCFINHGDEKDYIRCVFNFENVTELETLISKKLNKISLIRNAEIADLFLKLTDITDSQMPDYEKNIYMKSLFMQLLLYINEDGNLPNSSISTTTQKVIEYVRNNIDKRLTVDILANELHISQSHLAHTFKKELHISIHKYISELRLTIANKKIRNSVPPTRAAVECGFNDYSGFYKQYKKMFGISPGDVKNSIMIKSDNLFHISQQKS